MPHICLQSSAHNKKLELNHCGTHQWAIIANNSSELTNSTSGQVMRIFFRSEFKKKITIPMINIHAADVVSSMGRDDCRFAQKNACLISLSAEATQSLDRSSKGSNLTLRTE
jgi:hypothetical protein